VKALIPPALSRGFQERLRAARYSASSKDDPCAVPGRESGTQGDVQGSAGARTRIYGLASKPTATSHAPRRYFGFRWARCGAPRRQEGLPAFVDAWNPPRRGRVGLAAAILVMLFVQIPCVKLPTANRGDVPVEESFRTGVGEQRSIAFHDGCGSTMDLNTDSAVTVVSKGSDFHVRLLKGRLSSLCTPTRDDA
jgi:hypothetical protein